MSLSTTTVSIYRPTRPLDSAREPLSEDWLLVASGVPADLQPVDGAEELSPMGYSPTRQVECFFSFSQAPNLAAGYLIRDASGDCWRVISAPERWSTGSDADHLSLRAEWLPTPASLG